MCDSNNTNDIKWMMKIGGALFLIGLAMSGFSIKTIWGASMIAERLQNHIEIELRDQQRINDEFRELRESTKDLHNMYKEHIFYPSENLNHKISKKRDEWEKERDIVCTIDGEPA